MISGGGKVGIAVNIKPIVSKDVDCTTVSYIQLVGCTGLPANDPLY